MINRISWADSIKQPLITPIHWSHSAHLSTKKLLISFLPRRISGRGTVCWPKKHQTSKPWTFWVKSFSIYFIFTLIWERENHRHDEGSALYIHLSIIFSAPEAVGRNSQTFSCHCRQVYHLKDAPKPSHPSLSSSLTPFLLLPEHQNFSHMHPQLPFWKGHTTIVILHSSKLCQRENKIQSTGSDLKSLVFCLTVHLKESFSVRLVSCSTAVKALVISESKTLLRKKNQHVFVLMYWCKVEAETNDFHNCLSCFCLLISVSTKRRFKHWHLRSWNHTIFGTFAQICKSRDHVH